jgi:hypothetical protein
MSKVMPKHIAIVTSIHPDFDKRIWRHASSLAAAGCRVSLVGPWAVEPLSQRDGVTFYPFERSRSVWERFLVIPFRVFGRLRLILKDVDVVHFHDIDLLPWMAVLSIRKPVVYDVHENYPDEIMVRNWVPRLLSSAGFQDWSETSYLCPLIKNRIFSSKVSTEST